MNQNAPYVQGWILYAAEVTLILPVLDDAPPSYPWLLFALPVTVIVSVGVAFAHATLHRRLADTRTKGIALTAIVGAVFTAAMLAARYSLVKA